MLKWKRILLCGVCSSIAMLPHSAGADLESRHTRSQRSAIEPRIVRVDVEVDRLLIAGENLPRGSGVTVRLDDRRLRVIRSSPSLVIAELPSRRLEPANELVVRRGVRRAVARGRALDWGLR